MGREGERVESSAGGKSVKRQYCKKGMDSIKCLPLLTTCAVHSPSSQKICQAQQNKEYSALFLGKDRLNLFPCERLTLSVSLYKHALSAVLGLVNFKSISRQTIRQGFDDKLAKLSKKIKIQNFNFKTVVQFKKTEKAFRISIQTF